MSSVADGVKGRKRRRCRGALKLRKPREAEAEPAVLRGKMRGAAGWRREIKGSGEPASDETCSSPDRRCVEKETSEADDEEQGTRRCEDAEGQEVNLVAEGSWEGGKRPALPQSALSALPTNPRVHCSRY